MRVNGEASASPSTLIHITSPFHTSIPFHTPSHTTHRSSIAPAAPPAASLAVQPAHAPRRPASCSISSPPAVGAGPEPPPTGVVPAINIVAERSSTAQLGTELGRARELLRSVARHLAFVGV